MSLPGAAETTQVPGTVPQAERGFQPFSGKDNLILWSLVSL